MRKCVVRDLYEVGPCEWCGHNLDIGDIFFEEPENMLLFYCSPHCLRMHQDDRNRKVSCQDER